ncbi:MAG: winged helix-turn-helix domain-containing protein [Moraxellaceae bacterium]|nr:winged helix-turn-helix domain-containing protein [Moraxellaceae bacterium]
MSRVVALLLKNPVLARWLAFGLEQQHYLVLTPAGSDAALLRPDSPALVWKPDLWLVSAAMAADFRALLSAKPQEHHAPWRLIADGGQSAALVDEVIWPSEPRALLLELHDYFALAAPVAADVTQQAGLRLDVPGQVAWVGSIAVTLSPQSLRLLHLLMLSPGRVFTRQQLLEAVWQEDGSVDERSVDVLIYRLRRQLAAAGVAHLLESIRGRGYRLRVEPDSGSVPALHVS